jgi:DnaJ-class molecular chaperone
MRDPYSVLGVSRQANIEDIKQAYRALAKQYHPDIAQNTLQSSSVFQEISQAYGLLSNAQKRSDFDQGSIQADGSATRKSKTRPQPTSPQAQRPQQAARPRPMPAQRPKAKPEPTKEPKGPNLRAKADDVVNDLFANVKARAKQSATKDGSDETYALEISFEESARGTNRRVKLPGGRRLDVKIPAGVQSGQQIRLRGQGEKGSGNGESGDALIEISIADHKHFSRKEYDVFLTLPIGVDEAILGAKVMVPTLEGAVAIAVPPNSNTDTTLCLKGMGFPHPGNGPTRRLGNQYIQLKVVLPPSEDTSFAQVIRKWADRNPYNVRREFDFSGGSR